jgi:hypothetical protein
VAQALEMIRKRSTNRMLSAAERDG